MKPQPHMIPIIIPTRKPRPVPPILAALQVAACVALGAVGVAAVVIIHTLTH